MITLIITYKMLTLIPRPVMPGFVIGLVSTENERFISVYWNASVDRVVYNYGRDWFVSDATVSPLESIAELLHVSVGQLVIDQFQLLEHGKEITQREDDKYFTECEWSDYVSDHLCVGVKLEVMPPLVPPGGGD